MIDQLSTLVIGLLATIDVTLKPSSSHATLVMFPSQMLLQVILPAILSVTSLFSAGKDLKKHTKCLAIVPLVEESCLQTYIFFICSGGARNQRQRRGHNSYRTYKQRSMRMRHMQGSSRLNLQRPCAWAIYGHIYMAMLAPVCARARGQ